MSKDTDPQAGDTSETLKLKIEKRQAEMAKPVKEAVAPEPIKVESQKATVATETPQEPKAPVNNGNSVGGTTPKEEVDPVSWARKKGLTSEEAIARSLREMESEFHRRNQTKWKAPEPSVQTPPPAYNPPAYVPQNQYQAPAPMPRQILENIARQYNMAPEDAERLMAFNKDFVEVALANERKRWQGEIQEIKKDNARNSEFRELLQDPVFKNPQVQSEMHRIIQEDPTVFERESEPFKNAYQNALNNIARRNLQGTSDSQESLNIMQPPTNPPKPLNGGSGGVGSGETGMFSEKEFASLPLEEKAKVLSRMGVRPRE